MLPKLFPFTLAVLLTACKSESTVTVETEPGASPWVAGWKKPPQNPILGPDTSLQFVNPHTGMLSRWAAADLFNPAAVLKGDSMYLLFRAEDDPGAGLGYRNSSIGLAASADGHHFVKRSSPVLYSSPDDGLAMYDHPGGCEDPRVLMHPEGGYVMLYTSWNRDIARLSAAYSPDLINWRKEGPVFEDAYGGRFKDLWSKSGSVVGRLDADNQTVAVQINDKYWMYWGDVHTHIAFSDNLLDWTPLLDEQGDLRKVMSPRKGHFDSNLTEPGPPALLTPKGIWLIYNGRNEPIDSLRDPNLAPGTYCAGQALFSADDPARLIARQEQPFLCPDLPHERSGQYAAGTTFAQGLVKKEGKWLLYYGTADSMIGLAEAEADDKREEGGTTDR